MSTPMTYTFCPRARASFTAWMTPSPSPPAAWKTTSAPLASRSCATCLPALTLSKLPV